MGRDRTARLRIRRHLATRGPVVDPSGRATSELMAAVGYEGSQVGFIQLVAAMDRDGELVREIRGKRTYAISLPTATAGTGGTVDHDELARALLREVWHVLGSTVVAEELETLRDQRDDYARRLDLAERHLAALLGAGTARTPWDAALAAKGRTLLGELAAVPTADEQAV